MNHKHHLSAILLLAAIFLSCFSGYAQHVSDTIRMEKTWGGYVYYKDNTRLSFKQLLHLTNSNLEAVKLLEKSNDMRIASYIVGIPGSFAFGFSLGYALGALIVGNTFNKNIVYPILGAGIALTSIGIGLEIGANTKAKQGVAIYNNAIKQKNNAHLNLGISTDGILLRLNF
jgi:hypothetical protein